MKKQYNQPSIQCTSVQANTIICLSVRTPGVNMNYGGGSGTGDAM